jgi:hypothetical protein
MWASSVKVCGNGEKPLLKGGLWKIFCGRQTASGGEQRPRPRQTYGMGERTWAGEACRPGGWKRW